MKKQGTVLKKLKDTNRVTNARNHKRTNNDLQNITQKAKD